MLADAQALAEHVARWMCSVANEAGERCGIALSGGSTPALLYRTLAGSELSERFPWPRADWFWGDERFVPHEDARSNFRLAWNAMLSKIPVAAEHIHPVPVQASSPNAAAVAYERILQDYYGGEQLHPARSLFDIVLLGLGEDGHFASLFPGDPALDERTDWTVAVIGPQPEPRVTLTYPALESCRAAAFLVCGAGKAQVLAKFLAGAADLPPTKFHPQGRLHVFCDAAAAAHLSART